MTDKDIRPIVRQQLALQHPGAMLVEEIDLVDSRRADMAIVNGHLWGYEIKSERDTLHRLPLQMPIYNATFDYCHAIVADKFLKETRALVPRHWGLWRVTNKDGQANVEVVRTAKFNPHTTASGVCWFLHKPDAIRVLRSVGNRISSRKSSYLIWQELKQLPREILHQAAREAFTTRKLLEGRGQLLPGGD